MFYILKPPKFWVTYCPIGPPDFEKKNNVRGHPGGRCGRSYLPKLSHFSLFQARGEVILHSIYRKNIPKDYHFSSKLQKTAKTSPCFKFVGLPLNMHVFIITKLQVVNLFNLTIFFKKVYNYFIIICSLLLKCHTFPCL